METHWNEEEVGKRMKELQKKADKAAREHKEAMRKAMDEVTIDGSSFEQPGSDEERMLSPANTTLEYIPGKIGYSRPQIEKFNVRGILRHYLSIMEKEGMVVGVREVEDRLLECLLRCIEQIKNDTSTYQTR